MKRIFDDILTEDKDWLVEQTKWQKEMQQERETHFTLGNGMIGSRGICEELPYHAWPGTYVAGIYDRFGAQIPELVNLPNPLVFRVDMGGEKLDPMAMDVVDHYRALDMQKALLVRHTVYKTAHKKHIDYQSYRFVSRYHKYVSAMVVAITPKDADMTFNICSILDTTVYNTGMHTEGRKRHYEVTELSVKGHINYTEVRTFECQHAIGYATCIEVQQGKKRWLQEDRMFNIKVKKGETVQFIRYVIMVPSFYAHTKNVRRVALNELKKARILGIQRLFQVHEKEWRKNWDVSDVLINAKGDWQRAIRFNAYHLLISGLRDNRVSVGARTLSGEGYRGHIFWDAETFVFPYFLFNKPDVARCMLMYRYQRLDYARKIAATKGYRGVLFPWESADTGDETTPSWYKDSSGQICTIETMNEEHHIVADVAYAINQYVLATGDMDFMIDHGLEMLIETARFWMSRSTYNTKKDYYEIKHAMGPDEFHCDVNNNAFTNELACFNLELAVQWHDWALKNKKAKWKELAKKIKVRVSEISEWEEVAGKIYVSHSKKKNIIEQFEGYLKRKDVKIKELDEKFMPVIPPGVIPVENGKTQFLKQADVVMLQFMFPEKYSLEEIKKNFDYYEPRTLHKSSLSAAIHGAMAMKIGYHEKAMHYLSVGLNMDLQNIAGNTREGFHAATGGGIWQAFVFGLAGMVVKSDRISFTPEIPEIWRSVKFKVFYQGDLIRVSAKQTSTKITRLSTKNKKSIFVEVYGKRKILPAKKNVFYVFKK